MPRMSTSSTPIRNTIDARTAFGHVLQRHREEQQHDQDDHRGRELRELAPTAGAVDHLGLRRAAVHDERARQACRDVRERESDEVEVLVERSAYFAA